MAINRYPAPSTKIVDFTSSGTWTCPSGVYSAEFMVVGAGGAGGGTSVTTALNYAAAGGGGGGAVKKVKLATIPGGSYTITIGAKGTGASAAVGGNGGFSEIVYSGTTLVRAFGGQGGGACILDTSTIPTISRNIAGAGGGAVNANTTVSQSGGGGGGAVSGANIAFNRAAESTNNLWGSEGTSGGNGTATTSGQFTSFGTGGIDGYGAGGSGGSTLVSTRQVAGNSYFAGAGNLQTSTGAGNGTAAIANTGCGGGGGASFLSTTSTSGGNGADGLIRIEYVA